MIRSNRYAILRVDGYAITTTALVGGSGYPGAMFTVCDTADACRELAHFEARTSHSREVRDANIVGARYQAELFVSRLTWRNRIGGSE